MSRRPYISEQKFYRHVIVGMVCIVGLLSVLVGHLVVAPLLLAAIR